MSTAVSAILAPLVATPPTPVPAKAAGLGFLSFFMDLQERAMPGQPPEEVPDPTPQADNAGDSAAPEAEGALVAIAFVPVAPAPLPGAQLHGETLPVPIDAAPEVVRPELSARAGPAIDTLTTPPAPALASFAPPSDPPSALPVTAQQPALPMADAAQPAPAPMAPMAPSRDPQPPVAAAPVALAPPVRAAVAPESAEALAHPAETSPQDAPQPGAPQPSVRTTTLPADPALPLASQPGTGPQGTRTLQVAADPASHLAPQPGLAPVFIGAAPHPAGTALPLAPPPLAGPEPRITATHPAPVVPAPPADAALSIRSDNRLTIAPVPVAPPEGIAKPAVQTGSGALLQGRLVLAEGRDSVAPRAFTLAQPAPRPPVGLAPMPLQHPATAPHLAPQDAALQTPAAPPVAQTPAADPAKALSRDFSPVPPPPTPAAPRDTRPLTPAHHVNTLMPLGKTPDLLPLATLATTAPKPATLAELSGPAPLDGSPEAAPSWHDPTPTTLRAAPPSHPPALPIAPPIAQQIARQIPPEGANRAGFEIALQPEELGRVTLKLSQEDGASTLLISAERPETLDLMRRHIAALEVELRANGHENLTLRFSGGGGGQTPGESPGSGNPARNAPPHTESPPAPPAARATARTGLSDHLDIRL